MQRYFPRMFSSLALVPAIAWCLQAGAATQLVDQVHTVATSSTGVPVEHDFQITAAGTYTITLTDVGEQATSPATPIPLASLALALTANDALVGTPIVVEGTGAPSSGINTLTFTAPTSATYPMTYRLHIVGAPTSGNGAGPISTQITAGSSTNTGTVAACTSESGTPTPPCSWNDSIGLPSQALPATAASLEDSFVISTGGSYQIALNDFALPHSLGTLSVLVVNVSAGFTKVLPDSGNGNATQETVTLAPGTYQVYAVAAVASGASGGLFSFVVTPGGGGSALYGKAVPVGTTVQLGSTFSLSAGASALTVTDLAFPVALSQLSTDLVTSGQLAATASGGQTMSFTAAAGSYQLFGVATAATGSGMLGTGSYVAQVTQGSTTAFSVAQPVTTSGGSVLAYSFPVQIASAGSYTAALADFQTPSNLTAGRLAVVQNGVLAGSLSATGSTPVTLAATTTAAPVTLLAFAQAGSTAGSTMDVNLTDSRQSYLLDQPIGVGIAFTATQVAIPSNASYDFTLGDLRWPAAFGTLTGIVTQGGTVVGQIYGGGTLSAIEVNEGTYYVNILATPATGSTNTSDAGTYVLNVSPPPAAPTVSLTASPTSVSSGGTVQLSWTVTDATSCTASGGNWSGTYAGSQATSGSATSPAITAQTTFTLTCTGTGGTGSGTATVSIASGHSGGGGSLDGEVLAVLALALALRAFARRET